MKKLLLVITMTLMCSVASAQIKLAVKGGANFNVSEFNFSDESIIREGSTPAGFHLGIGLKLKLIPLLYVQGDALFTHSSYKYNINTGGNVKYRQETIDFPVVVGVQALFMRAYAGPTFSVNIDRKQTKSLDCIADIQDDYSSNCMGYQIGVGFDILKKISLDLNYNAKFSSASHGISIGKDFYKGKLYNRQIMMTVGFYLL
ncbi:MAG: outer membrane beta-barrel protein [Bacteroidetes bacterium]|nr:outer membrane beta-barrel protein [Bacteroidota bacterium]